MRSKCSCSSLEPLLVSRKELAVVLGISLRTLDRHITRCELRPIRKGRRVLFHRKEVAYFVNGFSKTNGAMKAMSLREPLLLSRKQAAVVLDKSLRTVDNLVTRRALRTLRVGRRVLFDPRALESYRNYHLVTAKKENANGIERDHSSSSPRDSSDFSRVKGAF